jgi:restriction system protein
MSGYKDLLVYRLSVTIYDLNIEFYTRFLSDVKYRRTVEQMHQAARSGKQNIVEGSLEKSTASDMMLVGVARASFEELLEDYADFLRERGLPVWAKEDPRVLRVRAFRETTEQETNLTNLAHWTNLDFHKAENYANLMICLLHKENYLLDQLSRSKERNFIQNGGFRENLFRKRSEYKKNKLD